MLRRNFLGKSLVIGSITGLNMITGCAASSEEEDEISPAEDLMREHGVLNRILLIYDACKIQLLNNQTFPLEALTESAGIIRNFIEDYHGRLEEDYLFPRFEKANKLTDLVQVLRNQHQAGRAVTDLIMQSAKAKSFSPEENQKLMKLITDFTIMYRPHEAREDTVLFPALRKIVSKNEYDAMGEDFEKKEHQLFGEDGFDVMVEKVANIEKQLGIYELSQFNPGIDI